MKQIPNFPNYFADREGNIYSVRKLRPSHDPRSGHPHVVLYRNGRRYYRFVHRLILETFIGPRLNGMVTRHLNGDSGDNHLENLCWGTQKENQQDSICHGTHNSILRRNGLLSPINLGKDNYNVKLTAQQVRIIVYTYQTGLFLQREIAKQYSVDSSTISNIMTRKTWKYLWRVA